MSLTTNGSISRSRTESTVVVFPKCDPLGLMRDAFRSQSLAAVRAENLVLAWLLSLSEEMDPALAARPVLAVFVDCAPGRQTRLRTRLAQLLQEITRYPRARLLAEADARRRRRARAG